jgi:hypothetical protein
VDEFLVPGESGFIKLCLDKVFDGLYIMVGRFLKFLYLFGIRFGELSIESSQLLKDGRINAG